METRDAKKLAAKQRRKYWRNPERARARKAGYRTEHRVEIRKRDEKYRAENRGEINGRALAARKIRPKRLFGKQMCFTRSVLFPAQWKMANKDYRLRSLCKVSLADFEKRKAEQGNRCVGCWRSFDEVGIRPVADHNKRTGAFRAILCNHCNLAIGHAYENPTVLRSLASYVQAS